MIYYRKDFEKRSLTNSSDSEYVSYDLVKSFSDEEIKSEMENLLSQKKSLLSQIEDINKFTDRIHRRLNKAISKEQIKDINRVICSKMAEILSEDQIISVGNFGTFSPYLFHGHLAYDPNTGAMQEIKPFYSVKLHPASSFIYLLKNRRGPFTAHKFTNDPSDLAAVAKKNDRKVKKDT